MDVGEFEAWEIMVNLTGEIRHIVITGRLFFAVPIYIVNMKTAQPKLLVFSPQVSGCFHSKSGRFMKIWMDSMPL